MSDATTFHDIPPVPVDMPFKRPPELLVPEGVLPQAEAFQCAVNAFMDQDEHRLIELGLHQGVRLDRYPEDGDTVYSIIHPIHPANPSRPENTLQATSIVAGEDGRTYGEWHWFKLHPVTGTSLGRIATPHAGVRHTLRSLEWRTQILPVTRALTDGRWLLKVVS